MSTVMKALVLLLCAYLHCCSSESFRGGQEAYNDGNSNAVYDWEYVISQHRGRSEQKDGDGIVTGVVSFLNANGNNVQWRYTAHPQRGFRVTEYDERPPRSNPFIDPSSLALHHEPLFKSSHDLGFVSAQGFDQGQAQFKIDSEVVRAAGSVSQLAKNLGAIPVAAVHDARAAPYQYRSPPNAPVLLSKSSGSGRTGNILDSDFYLLVSARRK